VKGTRLADDSSQKQSNFTINSLGGSFAQIRTVYSVGEGRVQCPRGQRPREGTVTKGLETEERPGVGGDASRLRLATAFDCCPSLHYKIRPYLCNLLSG
jgi:hypothetical protein